MSACAPTIRANAATRVTLTMGDKTYASVYDSADSKNIFDFDGTWYAVTYNEDKAGLDGVTALTAGAGVNELKNFYGTVNVKFESAFADLTHCKRCKYKAVKFRRRSDISSGGRALML